MTKRRAIRIDPIQRKTLPPSRSFKPRRITGTRMRCIERFKVPGGNEVVEVNEVGVVESIRGDFIIITFEDHEAHPFRIKIPRVNMESVDKFKGENE